MRNTNHGLSGVVRTEYSSCGQIARTPSRVFDWRQRKEEAATTTKRTCIFVFHNATGEKIPVYTSLASTLRSVKEEISKIMATPPNHIRLSWHGIRLVDNRTLVSYGIGHGHCVHLSCSICNADESDEKAESLPSPRRLMPLTIYMVDDSDRPMSTKLRVLARMYDKVLEVKLLLEAETGIPAGYMRLTMCGRSLANEHSLIECGVRDSSAVLQLVCVFGSLEMSSNDLRRNMHCAKPGCSAIECLEFHVTVKEIWSARSRRMGMTTDTTIRMLKEQVLRWNGTPLEKQMLLHRGRVLADDLTASYYNLETGSFIDLAVLGGAKPTEFGQMTKPTPRRTVVIAPRASVNHEESWSAQVAAFRFHSAGESLIMSSDDEDCLPNEDADEACGYERHGAAMSLRHGAGSRRSVGSVLDEEDEDKAISEARSDRKMKFRSTDSSFHRRSPSACSTNGRTTSGRTSIVDGIEVVEQPPEPALDFELEAESAQQLWRRAFLAHKRQISDEEKAAESTAEAAQSTEKAQAILAADMDVEQLLQAYEAKVVSEETGADEVVDDSSRFAR